MLSYDGEMLSSASISALSGHYVDIQVKRGCHILEDDRTGTVLLAYQVRL